METIHKTYILHPDVVFREEEDGAFLYNPETDAVRCINAVGASICKLCDGRSDLERICRSILDEYEVNVPEERLRSDVRDFVREMVSLNLLQENR